MKRSKAKISLVAFLFSAISFVPTVVSALGPDPAKGGVATPIGFDAAKPAQPNILPAPPGKGVAPVAGQVRKSGPPTPGAASAAVPAEPKWPQAFELGVGERNGFGFVVGRPGPIVVTVRWQGGPLAVTLGKPGGGAVERSGSGVVTILYAATADDVKNGVLWRIGLRPARGAANPAMGAGGKKRYQVEAKGTVAVQHPPGDAKRAQSEWNALAAKAKAEQSRPLPPAPPQPDALAQAKAGLQKQQAARRAQLLERIRPKIPAEAYRKMSARISGLKRGGIADDSIKPQPGATGQAPSGQSAATAAASKSVVPPKGPRTSVEVPGRTIGAVVPGVSSTQSGQVGAAGSTQPNTVASPVVASLSVASGQPGDPVTVSGSGFGGTPGEVHFIVANQRDLVAPITYWSGSQIVTEVPYTDGVPSYPGSVYVKRADGAKTGLLPFRFNPITDVATLGMTPDRMIKAPYDFRYLPGIAWHDGAGDLFGARGDDEFFLSTRLQNGWVVDRVYLTMTASDTTAIHIWGNANAYITESREGTNSPYVKVHWWRDGLSTVAYSPRVVILGPKGVPYR